jgi:ubiquinone/menaquinone biosynthesis C-methylase UbiE
VQRAIDPIRLKHLYDRLARRYDAQHALTTAGADGRGRRVLVRTAVRPGDRVLDAGGGTASTALLAAKQAGPEGRIVVLDQSRGMLEVGSRRAEESGMEDLLSFVLGNIERPPFRPETFDVVLSTYSMCPLVAPAEAAEELYRLVRPGGRLGVAHSTEPRGLIIGWLGRRIEAWAWRRSWLSMGCRAVSVLPRLRELGGLVEIDRRLGVPLWPFHVFVVRKPLG